MPVKHDLAGHGSSVRITPAARRRGYRRRKRLVHSGVPQCTTRRIRTTISVAVTGARRAASHAGSGSSPLWGFSCSAVGGLLFDGQQLSSRIRPRRGNKSTTARVKKSKAFDEERQSDPKRRIWKEDELAEAVKGKSPEEVRELIGVPDSMGLNVNGMIPSYHYIGRLYDNTGAVVDASVKFENGRRYGSCAMNERQRLQSSWLGTSCKSAEGDISLDVLLLPPNHRPAFGSRSCQRVRSV